MYGASKTKTTLCEETVVLEREGYKLQNCKVAHKSYENECLASGLDITPNPRRYKSTGGVGHKPGGWGDNVDEFFFWANGPAQIRPLPADKQMKDDKDITFFSTISPRYISCELVDLHRPLPLLPNVTKRRTGCRCWSDDKPVA
ncbi:hypothetical protein CBL_05301 [Carabus blaptoides fortunei]